MRALLCRAFGPPSSLRMEEVDAPVAGPGQVVIAVRACGVNFFDGLQVAGQYQIKPPFPFAPGAEVSGVVKAVGDGVAADRGLRVGARVLAFTRWGGLVEELAVDAWRVVPIPDAMDDETAAAFPIVYLTSLHALKDRGLVKAGETLLVLGAAGGVGLTAVEIGKIMGARVIAAASTPEKLALCQSRGADALIDYAKDDLRARIRELTDNRGLDVVYDPVGDRYTEPCVRSLAPGGRLLVVGFAAGEIPKLPLNLLLLKQAAAVGVFWGEFAATRPAENSENLAQILEWFAAGNLKPHVGATFPFERGREAIELVMNRGAKGKVVVRVAGPDARLSHS